MSLNSVVTAKCFDPHLFEQLGLNDPVADVGRDSCGVETVRDAGAVRSFTAGTQLPIGGTRFLLARAKNLDTGNIMQLRIIGMECRHEKSHKFAKFLLQLKFRGQPRGGDPKQSLHLHGLLRSSPERPGGRNRCPREENHQASLSVVPP